MLICRVHNASHIPELTIVKHQFIWCEVMPSGRHCHVHNNSVTYWQRYSSSWLIMLRQVKMSLVKRVYFTNSGWALDLLSRYTSWYSLVNVLMKADFTCWDTVGIQIVPKEDNMMIYVMLCWCQFKLRHNIHHLNIKASSAKPLASLVLGFFKQKLCLGLILVSVTLFCMCKSYI